LDHRTGALIGAAVFQARVMDMLREIARRQIGRGKGVKWMPEEYAVKLKKFPERVAAIVAKTYAELGDSAQISDDEAVSRIRDLLNELDENIIERNRKKKLNPR
jgi:hypothetical protein